MRICREKGCKPSLTCEPHLLLTELDDLNRVCRRRVMQFTSDVRKRALHRNDVRRLLTRICCLRTAAIQHYQRAGLCQRPACKFEVNCLRMRRGIDQLEIDALSLGVFCHGVKQFRSAILDIRAEGYVSDMLCENHLRVVARRSITPRCVITNQVAFPLHTAWIHIHKKWCVT